MAGTRSCRSQTLPEFERHLRSVIDSLVSDCVRSKENRLERRQTTVPGGAGEQDEADVEPPSKWIPHDQIVADQELLKEARKLLLAELGEEGLLPQLMECFEAGIESPADIAELLGVSVDEVYKAQKRYRLRAKKAWARVGKLRTA